ncbi:MAG: hypothetical protein FWD61_20545 [Phycisphaerales bacterium]|nr:hypothetical protein [Phycisphaerales bacterium]
MFEPRFLFLNPTRYTHGRRPLRGALADVSEYGVSPSGVEYIYDPSGRLERDVYDAYGTGERPYGSFVPRSAGWSSRFDMEALGEYQFQGHREDTETTAPAATSSESSAPSFLNFQIRAFHPQWVHPELVAILVTPSIFPTCHPAKRGRYGHFFGIATIGGCTHPKSAPWSAVDPAGYVDGLNVYLFSRGDPVNPVKPV